jgi:hypothetical protein
MNHNGRHDLIIPDDSWKNLKVFILNSQGDFKKGDISKWVTIAINNLVSGYNPHTRSTQNINPYQIPKGRLMAKNMMQDICRQLIQSGIRQAPINSGTTIPLKHLDQMIREVTGYHDERTIKKHVQILIKYGYLSDKGYPGALLIKDTGSDIEHIERVMDQQRREERGRENQRPQEFDSIIENT